MTKNANILGSAVAGLSALLFPNLCEGCNRQLTGAEHVLCISCEQHLLAANIQIVAGNEAELRFAGRIPFAYAASLTQFTEDSLLQHLVHGLKYRNKKAIGLYLGGLWGMQLKQAPWISEIDAIAPVPLHQAKEQKRGYNQSLLIATGIAKATGIPLLADLLIRVRNTESQTNKTRTERVDNTAEAFTLNGSCTMNTGHVLLCDDVLTTGATLESCGNALLANGRYKVSFTTIGIA